jgi:hypothetical protein
MIDGHRFTCFATDGKGGQLVGLAPSTEPPPVRTQITAAIALQVR